MTIGVTPDLRGLTVADMLRDVLAREFQNTEAQNERQRGGRPVVCSSGEILLRVASWPEASRVMRRRHRDAVRASLTNCFG